MTHPSDPTFPAPQTRSRRGLRVALVMSLMVNVLLIGVLAGGMIRFARFDPPTVAELDMRTLWHALPDDARRDLRSLSRSQGFPGEHGSRPTREERRERAAQVNAQLLELLRTEPFDSEAFAAMLSAERTRHARSLTAAQAAFAARVAQLSRQQRLEMAERLAEAQRHHMRR
ncbi:MAG: periplasmic heavy metal sensor [Pararhodobacter sp.]|nr:periplasmic heavy metal sensor [Pararhodobacter sp.]